MKLLFVLFFVSFHTSSNSLECWQCAMVNNRICPRDAVSIQSQTHDACVTWMLQNGTVILQNMVKFDEECASGKIKFWSDFIGFHYGGGIPGVVDCCRTSECNSAKRGPVISPFVLLPTTSQPIVQQNFPIASYSESRTSKLLSNNDSLYIAYLNPTTNRIDTLAQFYGGLNGNVGLFPSRWSDILINRKPNYPEPRPGNCRQYFTSVSADEWMPENMFPLTFDRASGSKVGVFYGKFKDSTTSNDHLIIRVSDKKKRNGTLYTFKLYKVGSASLYVSKLTPSISRPDGIQEETRKVSKNRGVNVSSSEYFGYWITFRGNEVALGKIGSTLVTPILIWNDTSSEGPMDPYYFGLTTAQSSASFGIDCDSPGLHYDDTCVEDLDCEKIPQTICLNTPVNSALGKYSLDYEYRKVWTISDQGTREEPFDEWEIRSTILKSCFCKEGHVRIPDSTGCYDPVRHVVTVRDSCFSDHHCQDLPNTECSEDFFSTAFNASCQCKIGYKPFEPDVKTGLIEGCAPLTEEEKLTILGCGEQFDVKSHIRVPSKTIEFEFKENLSSWMSAVFIQFLEESSSASSGSNVAAIRILDAYKSSSKMLTVLFKLSTKKISILESVKSQSFFFENDYDYERATVDASETLKKMKTEPVGFWILYSYESNLGGTISVGHNDVLPRQENALISWTDKSNSALKVPYYLGFSLGSSRSSPVRFGTNCNIVKESQVTPNTVEFSGLVNDVFQNNISPTSSRNPEISQALASILGLRTDIQGATPTNQNLNRLFTVQKLRDILKESSR